MRRALATFAAALAGSAALCATPALADNPSPARIHTAIRRAEHSASLWATVNVCNAPKYRDQIGIRGQMPSLGFAAWLSMNVKLLYYSRSQRKFVAVPSHGTKLVRLGRSSTGLQQGGALFQFAPHQPTLKAEVTFVWRREGRLLGETTLSTTSGHRNADYASPPHYSAATCTIS